MVTSNELLVAAIGTFAISLLAVLLVNRSKGGGGGKNKKLNLPPGPRGWPLVGNLFQVALSGKPIIHYVRELVPAYGPLFTLRMGARTLIVVTSAELAREVLIERGQAFASRPAENPTRNIFSCNKFTVNSAVYGPEWRSLRRNMVSGMLSSARLREFRALRHAAMDRLAARVRSEAEANAGEVWVLRNVRFAFFCILLSMCFGLDLDEPTIESVDLLMKKVLMTLMPRIDDYLPLLSPFFSKERKKALEVRREQVETIGRLIEKRREVLRNPDKHPTAAPFSYLDSLFDLKVEGRATPPTQNELVTLTSEFLNGGTDTTATAIEWAVARLIDNPAIQARLHNEIEDVVGREGRAVEETDVERLPYLQAFVKELLRRHPPTYFSLTHAAVGPGEKLGGYDVPADANLEIFYPTISEDPRLWKRPGEFIPERFLEGGEEADITGVKGIRMIPFGAGRRICPGLAMGTTHVSLIVARLVQEFEWLHHPAQPKLEFVETMEFTVVMKEKLRAVVKPRLKK